MPDGLQEDLEALDGIPATDTADHEIVGADTQSLAPDGGLVDDAVHLVQIDAVHHDGALIIREEPEAEPFRLLGGRDIDDDLAYPRELALEAEVQPPARAGVAAVVDAVKRVDGGHAQRARPDPAVQPGAFAVRVHDVDAVPLDQPHRQRQVTHAEPGQGQFDHRHPEVAEAVEEDPVTRCRDHHLELVAGQVAHEIVDVLRAASRTRGDEQVQDVDRSGHRATPAGDMGRGTASGSGRSARRVTRPTRTHPELALGPRVMEEELCPIESEYTGHPARGARPSG